MDQKEMDSIKDLLLETAEEILSTQLKAIRKLRQYPQIIETPDHQRRRTSKIDMAINVLKSAQRPLHISTLMEEIEKQFGVSTERDSLVSALIKKSKILPHLSRTQKNTFYF